MVDDYINDDLVDDLEDMKRMEQAERMAKRKLAKTCKAATLETRGTKRRFPFRGSRQEEVPTLRAPQLLPTLRVLFHPASGVQSTMVRWCIGRMLPV